MNNGHKVLILVENYPLPFDRRVWLEAKTLRAAGYQVSIICPKGKGATESFVEIDDIRIYRYTAWEAKKGALAFAVEFSWCWLRTFLLTIKVLFRDGFDVIHACNPPDTFWLIGAIYKPFGKRFIFDQHDLNPEVYLSKFPDKNGDFAHRMLYWFEKMTYRMADVVIAMNESYRNTAMARGGVPPERVVVVRTGPDFERLHPVPPEPSLKEGARFLVAYLGTMAPQDGVDFLLQAADHIVQCSGVGLAVNQQAQAFLVIGGRHDTHCGIGIADIRHQRPGLGRNDGLSRHFRQSLWRGRRRQNVQRPAAVDQRFGEIEQLFPLEVAPERQHAIGMAGQHRGRQLIEGHRHERERPVDARHDRARHLDGGTDRLPVGDIGEGRPGQRMGQADVRHRSGGDLADGGSEPRHQRLQLGDAGAAFLDDFLGRLGDEAGIVQPRFHLAGLALGLGDFLFQARALGGKVDDLAQRQDQGGLAYDKLDRALRRRLAYRHVADAGEALDGVGLLGEAGVGFGSTCLLYTSPSPRD